MRQRVLVLAGMTLLVTGGCATKSFVREEIGKSETRTGQQVGRVDDDLGQEKARITGLTGQVTESTRRADEVSAASNQAALRADQAAARADQATAVASQALARADQTDGRLTRLWATRNKRTLGATVSIRFAFDRAQIDDRGETALLDVAKILQENPTVLVDLEGYTDAVGNAGYNLALSQRRVEAVRRFLVEKGVELHRIQSIGLGDSRAVADNKTKDGRDQNRRVIVKLFDLPD